MGEDPARGPLPDHDAPDDSTGADEALLAAVQRVVDRGLDVGPNLAGLTPDERATALASFAHEIVRVPPPLADVLASTCELLRRYIVLPADHYYLVVALWILHAHAISAADTTPRLIFKSPEKESGKTRCLECLDALVPAPLQVISVTTAAIFRLLKDEQVTVLFDEVDAIFNPRATNQEDLRALLNAGYRRGATVARVVGDGKRMRVERFPVFAATALAAIGDLPDTIESRSIIVPMRRRAPDETVAKFRSRQVALEVVELRGDLVNWASIYATELSRADPVMPGGLEDRAEDCWAPLLAIADMAGKGWGERARSAALLIAKGRVAEDASTGVRLLADIKTVIGDRDRLSSAALCSALNALEESGWGGWNDGKGIGQRDLAKRLKAYGVVSKVIKLSDGTTARGYMRGEFADPFARYLRDGRPIEGVTSATNVTATRSDVTDVTEVTATQRTTTTPLETFQHQVDTTLNKVNGGLPHGWLEQDDARRRALLDAGKRRKAAFTRSRSTR